MLQSTCKHIYIVFHSHIISIFFYLCPNRTWNFATKIFCYRSFPIITWHGTEKVLLMQFEILGLAKSGGKTTGMPINVPRLSLGVRKCPVWDDSKISNGLPSEWKREQNPASYCLEKLGRTLLELTNVLRPLQKLYAKTAGLIRLHVNAD